MHVKYDGLEINAAMGISMEMVQIGHNRWAICGSLGMCMSRGGGGSGWDGDIKRGMHWLLVLLYDTR
jgi:hypothetical protein